MYCIEYLERNLDWLLDRLAPLAEAGAYFIFDCPGQVRARLGRGLACRRLGCGGARVGWGSLALALWACACTRRLAGRAQRRARASAQAVHAKAGAGEVWGDA